MSNRVQHVTIVGGGTAGWLAAGILQMGLNRRGDGEDVRITVIESPNIPTIGVGEATTVSMGATLKQMGLDERDFLKQCDGSFKCAVKFANWNHDADGRPLTFWHPFSRQGYLHGHDATYHYIKARKMGGEKPFEEALFPSITAVKNCQAPRAFEGKDYVGGFPYAYHMDATLFANYLTTYATNLGVEHVQDDVTEVNLDERGYVKSLTLKENGDWPIELEPFEPYSEHLLCDKALAVQIPCGETDKIESYTTSTGLNAGWSWRVPLYTRVGTGYVFSSAFASDDEAITEFRRYLDLPDDHPDPRVIPMRIGRSRRCWVKNCIAIGLSGGFIEPLESTSIHFTQVAVRWLIEYFPDRDINPAFGEHYNRIVHNLYDEIRDFIVFHYATSNRTDTPFWIEASRETRIPDSLKSRLDLWKVKLPGSLECNNVFSLFESWNYVNILMGKGWYDNVELPSEAAVSVEDYMEARKGLAEETRRISASAPDHRAVLTQIRAGDYRPWYNPVPAAAPPALNEVAEAAALAIA
jgi:tryptophan halogenase